MSTPQIPPSDSFIEEVRQRRRYVSAKFGHDVNRYFDEPMRREKEHPERLGAPARGTIVESTGRADLPR
jgi:hypothetical protein